MRHCSNGQFGASLDRASPGWRPGKGCVDVDASRDQFAGLEIAGTVLRTSAGKLATWLHVLRDPWMASKLFCSAPLWSSSCLSEGSRRPSCRSSLIPEGSKGTSAHVPCSDTPPPGTRPKHVQALAWLVTSSRWYQSSMAVPLYLALSRLWHIQGPEAREWFNRRHAASQPVLYMYLHCSHPSVDMGWINVFTLSAVSGQHRAEVTCRRCVSCRCLDTRCTYGIDDRSSVHVCKCEYGTDTSTTYAPFAGKRGKQPALSTNLGAATGTASVFKRL
ncbi:hypothetical protein M431DRAFT_478116 [Trichoderma harzianum CBS 226.95]|uniref:Uncharacterized protein n=1 Tax=Trichoderma harzianum CBS 226.95 TaxID=983964 RepID=A0A2T4API5_TRIHA|nr:hypothetical protein M431DRAFT_478116 [Trichoderma harzianum CBS 226.95]PTB58979.1 hypothetical protein M431DRAFT_478116 [Trichoderma harzianum CBS 226.95]